MSGRLSLQGLCEHRLQKYDFSKSRRLAVDLAKCNLSERVGRGAVPDDYVVRSSVALKLPISKTHTLNSSALIPKNNFPKKFLGDVWLWGLRSKFAVFSRKTKDLRLACKSIFLKSRTPPPVLSVPHASLASPRLSVPRSPRLSALNIEYSIKTLILFVQDRQG